LLQRNLERRQWQLHSQRQLLAALSPQRLLQRGYCLLRSSEGQLLRDGSTLSAGDAVEAQLHQGVLSLTVQTWQPETSEVS
jgi:exodeoxyribonuclease VII large subunit